MSHAQKLLLASWLELDLSQAQLITESSADDLGAIAMLIRGAAKRGDIDSSIVATVRRERLYVALT